jgi:hypothetical protein
MTLIPPMTFSLCSSMLAIHMQFHAHHTTSMTIVVRIFMSCSLIFFEKDVA